jgi:GNAT superfamily N-acetyltransferase
MDNTKLVIRRANTNDIEHLADLLVELFSIETDFTVDRAKHIIGINRIILDVDRSVIFVAEHRDQIVGMVSGQLVISTAAGGYSVLLEDMCVAGEFRRSGTGSALLQNLAVWGKNKGAKRVQLVADSKNQPAISFYLKKGFSSSRMTGMYFIIE